MIDQSVTMVVRHHILSGKKDLFNEWVTMLGNHLKDFEGFLGLTILFSGNPDDSLRVIIARFSCYERLEAWELSAGRDSLVNILQTLATPNPKIEKISGLEYWFEVPYSTGLSVVQTPARYKMAVITWLAVFPLSLVLPNFFSFLLPSTTSPLFLSVIATMTMIAVMTWLIMPFMVRFFSFWLRPNQFQLKL